MTPTITVSGPHPAIDYLHLGNGRRVIVPGGNLVNVVRAASSLAWERYQGRSVRSVAVICEDDLNVFKSSLEGCSELWLTVVKGKTRRNHTFAFPGRPERYRPGKSNYYVDSEAVGQLTRPLREVRSGEWVVLTGSLPPGIEPTFYMDIIQMLQDQGAHVVFDARASDLRAVLDAGVRPDVIKPNLQELKGLVNGSPIDTHQHLIDRAEELLPDGLAIISLGREGILARNADGQAWHLRGALPLGKQFVTSVGCGDSLVGWFTFASADGSDTLQALRFGVAASVANVTEPIPGEFPVGLALEIERQVQVTEVASAIYSRAVPA
jgi:6-phosphofructokinase 2